MRSKAELLSVSICAPSVAKSILSLALIRDQFFALGDLPVALRHHLSQGFERDLRLPLQLLAGLARVAQEQVDLGRAEVAGVDFDVFLPVEVEDAEHLVEERADAVGLARGDDE